MFVTVLTKMWVFLYLLPNSSTPYSYVLVDLRYILYNPTKYMFTCVCGQISCWLLALEGGVWRGELLRGKTLWRHHEVLSVRFRNRHTCWSYECIANRVNVCERDVMLAGRLRYAWQRPPWADSSYVICYGAQPASNRVPAGSSMWSLSSEREILRSHYCV
jgi:hypothetical protein